jgi:hypothetical protein
MKNISNEPYFSSISTKSGRSKIQFTSQTLADGTCLVVFQTAFPFDPKSFFSIVRIYQNGDGQMFQAKGSIVGQNRNKKSALVILTKPGDLIRITESCPRFNTKDVRFYKIGDVGNAIPLPEDVKDFSDEAILELLVDAAPDHLPQWDQCYDSMIKYLALNWPAWFRGIVERQTRSLKKVNRELWWHLSASSVDERELRRVVRDNPYLALKLFKSRLDEEQLLNCIKNSLSGAIQFAFDDLTDDQICDAANTHPDLLLTHAANKLNQNIFEFCVYESFETALEIRATMTASNRAVFFSQALSGGFFSLYGPVKAPIIEEIRNSLITNHDVWNKTYEGDYFRLYSELVSIEIFDFSSDDKMLLYKGIRSVLPDSEKLPFELFVAEQI